MNKPNIFKRFFGFVKSWYERLFSEFKEEGTAAVIATNILKEIIESPITEIGVALTPTTLDDQALVWAKAYIPNAINVWAQARNLAAEGASNIQVLSIVQNYLESITKDAKKEFWLSISADLAVYLSDGKLSWSEAVILTQKIYREKFSNQPSVLLQAA